jgi:predicted ATPase
MDWSYDLLDIEERRVLGELSVFAGTFGLSGMPLCRYGRSSAR